MSGSSNSLSYVELPSPRDETGLAQSRHGAVRAEDEVGIEEQRDDVEDNPFSVDDGRKAGKGKKREVIVSPFVLHSPPPARRTRQRHSDTAAAVLEDAEGEEAPNGDLMEVKGGGKSLLEMFLAADQQTKKARRAASKGKGRRIVEEAVGDVGENVPEAGAKVLSDGDDEDALPTVPDFAARTRRRRKPSPSPLSSPIDSFDHDASPAPPPVPAQPEQKRITAAKRASKANRKRAASSESDEEDLTTQDLVGLLPKRRAAGWGTKGGLTKKESRKRKSKNAAEKDEGEEGETDYDEPPLPRQRRTSGAKGNKPKAKTFGSRFAGRSHDATIKSRKAPKAVFSNSPVDTDAANKRDNRRRHFDEVDDFELKSVCAAA
ncbi:hypothetical protein MNV49_001724 [Pseudohyphozyma bogoriensis]|nr:hypothetical protein MNV49_001724 [Pseudohyphozyma bogoriensis]